MLRLQGVAANGLMMYTIKICAFRQQEKRQICCYHISAIIHWSRSWIYQKKIDRANVIEIDGHQLSQLDSKNSTSIAASAAEIAEKTRISAIMSSTFYILMLMMHVRCKISFQKSNIFLTNANTLACMVEIKWNLIQIAWHHNQSFGGKQSSFHHSRRSREWPKSKLHFA